MSPPVTFSVVVPVHDVRPYLAECLDSILGQSFTDLEVIAVDDESTDGSGELLDEYAAADPRLNVVHLASNVGLGLARDTGLDLATGKYLLFVDSDDSLAEGALAAIAGRIAETHEPDVVLFDFVRTHASGEPTPDALSAALVRGGADISLRSHPRLLDLFPVAWNKAYRREFVVAGGFRFPTGFYEDLPWTYPVLVTAQRIVTLDRVCYLYRQRTGQILRSADRRHLDFFTQFGLVFDFLDAHPELEAWRAPLYGRLTRHAPWILEIRDRVSPELRRDFFEAASTSFRRHRPAGFTAPSRTAQWKIGLIERGDYRAFRAAQLGNVARRRAGTLRRRPPNAAALPAEAARYRDAPRAALALLASPEPSVDDQRAALDLVLPLLVEDGRFAAATALLPVEITDEFHDALAELVPRVDPQLIAERTDLPEQLRAALLVGLAGRPAPPPRSTTDRLRGLVRLRYYVGAQRPDERIMLDGVAVEPRHAKLRAVTYLGRVLVHERILWVPRDAQVTLDGEDARDRAVAPASASSLSARARRLRGRVDLGLLRTVATDLGIRLASRRPAARERFGDCWLLIDRDSEAQDNAEHVYRHLRTTRPDLNAFFVLRRESADWARLEREGFRLLPFGTREHYVALLHCVQLLSSQVDTYVNQPFWQRLLGTPGWRFTFLQHGVTQNDLSRWIEGKPIDLVLTATPDEQQGFVANGTPYAFTSLDCVLTGFPRHDRLLALGAATPDPRSLLVMPSWRQHLVGAKAGGNRRTLLADFWASDFAQAWLEVLASEQVRTLCERTGWSLHFVPHPNLQDYVDSASLPTHVRTRRFRDLDVQQAIADAAVLVTDYSSLAFEAAYLQRRVVYYQFDRESFFAGGHVVRRGTWSYEQQGFGPVCESADGVLAALTAIADGTVDPVYARRAADTFPFRDGECCARAVAAVEALGRPAPTEQLLSR